jgi:hypothetical protein
LWQTLSDDFKFDLFGDEKPFGHGGETLISVMMYLFPEEMRMDLLKDLDTRKDWNGFRIKGLSKAGAEMGEYSFYFDMEDISSEGFRGNPEFKRFALRGLSKNTTDWSLICVAHNLMTSTSKKQLKIAKK